jgi:hypothetical protein
MKQTVTFSVFQQAFEAMRPDNFSYEGLSILFDYLEQYENDTGEQIELDVIALCCEYSEQSWEDVAKDYSIDLDDVEEDEKKQAVMHWLCDNTSVCGETDSGTFVYCSCF